jgi:two-component system, NtrC family, response regulator PilR
MKSSDLPQVANPTCSAARSISQDGLGDERTIAPEAAANDVATIDGLPRVGTRNKILIADDEPEILAEIAAYLRRRGEVVVDVDSFGDAMRAFNDTSGSIALVITDVRMPDGNGVDLVRWVINRSEGKCPCLLMTGHLDVTGLGTDLEAAGVRILDKPFAMSALYDLVRSKLPNANTDDR